jgi:uncharacterized protein (DUF1501 family)
MLDLTNSKAFTRRAFLARGLTLASAAATIPGFLHRSAWALADPDDGLVSRPGVPQERVLVVVQLAGGNDGLNTVIPFGEAMYYRSRPSLGVAEQDVLKLSRNGMGDGIGLHPRMTGLKEMYDEGLLSIVQGVGYPNPNRSHFKSMDIWHTADTSATSDGWIGRYFDNQCAGEAGGHDCSGHAGIALGRTAPLAMQGRVFKPISFETPDLFRWTSEGDDEAMDAAYRALTEGGAAPGGANAEPMATDNDADFLTRTALDAQIASAKIRTAVAQRPLAEYPRSGLAQQLAMVASMIRAGLETRVYYVSLGGFDTHAGQGNVNGSHANLLLQFSAAMRAFYQDLKAQGNDGRVLTMSFSEFGRRVAQNGSGGTDHGAAAPMFLMGPMVRSGLVGRHPSLADLDSGDLKYGVDFRNVYAGIVTEWLEADANKVLGGSWRPAKVLRT